MRRWVRPLLLAAAFCGGETSRSAAEPIYVQVGGDITSISASLGDAFDASAGFSFVFGWDPAPAYFVGSLPHTSVYSAPFSVSGMIGGRHVAFESFDWTEIFPGANQYVYFEHESALIAGTDRYGPDLDWGVRAFLLRLASWNDPLTGVPTHAPDGSQGSIEVFLADVVQISGQDRAGASFGGRIAGTTTSVQAIPEVSTASSLALGVLVFAPLALIALRLHS